MTAFWATSDPVTPGRGRGEAATEGWLVMERWDDTCSPAAQARRWPSRAIFLDRKSVVWGKSVDLGGRRIIKKKREKMGRAADAASGIASYALRMWQVVVEDW